MLAAIRRLPEAYRETLVLRLVEGMTGPEIAERTGLTPGSVRVNLHRGMQLLREALGRRSDRERRLPLGRHGRARSRDPRLEAAPAAAARRVPPPPELVAAAPAGSPWRWAARGGRRAVLALARERRSARAPVARAGGLGPRAGSRATSWAESRVVREDTLAVGEWIETRRRARGCRSEGGDEIGEVQLEPARASGSSTPASARTACRSRAA